MNKVKSQITRLCVILQNDKNIYFRFSKKDSLTIKSKMYYVYQTITKTMQKRNFKKYNARIIQNVLETAGNTRIVWHDRDKYFTNDIIITLKLPMHVGTAYTDKVCMYVEL